MSSPTISFPFLSLPYELRERIYKELLVSDLGSPLTLYHDRYGRDTFFRIHLAVLRTDKQIYAECRPILYASTFRIDVSTRKVIQCEGGSYPDGLGDPDPLLREDKRHSQEAPNPFLKRRPVSDGQVRFPHGMIYAECLQRLHHIELVTSPSAVWASTMGGDFFSSIGNLIIKLLGILAADPASAQGPTKTLKFRVKSDWRGCSLFPSKSDNGVGDIAKGLKALSKIRAVEVIEDGRSLDLTALDSR